METLTNYKIPTKRKVVEVAAEVDPVEESSSASTPDLPENWDIIDATEEETREIQEIIAESPKKTNTPFAEECWKQMTVQNVQIIRNRRLRRSYDNYKRKHRILNDTMAYRVVYDQEEIQRIAEDGLSVDNDSLVDIGDQIRGVVLFNSPAMAYSGRYLYANIPIHVMMFRTAIMGKRNEITWGGHCLPSKNHTSHCLMMAGGVKNKFHKFLLDHYEAAVYYYEYMPNKADVLKYPTMLLPYAVITFTLPETAFPTQGIQKSKINRSFLFFGDREFCKHTLVFESDEIPATVCLPSFLQDVPYVLHESRSTPVACCINNLSQFPELDWLRCQDGFGKMFSTDSVILPDLSLVSYFTLRFAAEQKSFVDLFRKNKYILVWTNYPFTVYYIPSGEISSHFGFPHKDMHMHLIVHRTGLPEATSFSMFSHSDVPLDYALYWNKPLEYEAETAEPEEFEDTIYDDDYGDELMEKREEEEAKKQEELVYVSPPSAVPPIATPPIIKPKNSSSKKGKIRWRDEAHPGHIPGTLADTRYFDKDESSTPQYSEDDHLSFDERRQKQRHDEKVLIDEDKKEREQNGTDDLFKNAMTDGASRGSPVSPFYDPESVPYSPDSSPRKNPSPSPSPDVTSPPTSENTNTASPSSVCAPSPDELDFMKNVPKTFNVPPPNFSPPTKTTTTAAVKSIAAPFLTDLSVPPPPIPRRNGSPSPDFSAPPPGFSPLVPPPTVFPTSRGTPPPPGANSAPSNSLPPPSLLIPTGLITPTVRPSCLVPDSGPPKDPRRSVDYVKDSLSTTSSVPDSSEPVEEQGEEPMDVDDEDSSGMETANEDNEILMQCFTAGPAPAPAPVSAPVSTEHEIVPDPLVQKNLANMIRGSNQIMDLIGRKKLESSNSTSSSSETELNGTKKSAPSASEPQLQDTDLRVKSSSHVNFTINKAKPPSVLKGPNAFRCDSDSDDDTDNIPLPPGNAPSTAQDIDYRKLQPVTSRSNSYTQDRDDRPGSFSARIHSILHPVQGKEQATSDDKEGNINHQSENQSQLPPIPGPCPTIVPLPTVPSEFVGIFPNLLSVSRTPLGLRGVLSMRTSSDVSVGSEQSSSSTTMSSNGNGHVSTAALTRKLNEILSPTQTKEQPKIGESSSRDMDLKTNRVEISDSDIMIIDDPIPSNTTTPRPSRTILDTPPGVTKRTPNQFQVRSEINQRVYNPGQGNTIRTMPFNGFSPNSNSSNGHGSGYGSTENWMSKIPKFRRKDVTNICIFFDPIVPDDISKTMISTEFRTTFEKLIRLNGVMPPAKSMIESMVFIHHSVQTELNEKTTVITLNHHLKTFMKFSTLVHPLPEHGCDTPEFRSKESTEIFANCILEIIARTGGTKAVYLTNNCTEETPRGRIFAEKDIKVMNFRQLNQFVDETLKS